MDRIERNYYLTHHIVPWYDENGIYYIGLEDFCLNGIEELDSTL